MSLITYFNYRQLPDKPKKKVIGPTPFNQQLSKD